MKELDIVRSWLELVGEKNQWSHFGDWTNHQFQLLSDEISEKSGIKIDRNTIRKIVESAKEGKPYSPHLSTKDALAVYLGKKNWSQYVEDQKKPANSITVKKRALIAGVAVVCMISLLFVIIPDNTEEWFEFSVENPEGIIPHTVVCNYNLDGLKEDDIYIDYGHVDPGGNYKLVKINKNSSINKNCFHYPGSYLIRLFAGDEVKVKDKVWINSSDWFIYAIDAASYISKYEIPEVLKKAGSSILQFIPFNSILEKQTTGDGLFYIPEEKIMQIDGQTVNHHLHLRNFRPFGIDMENAQFSIRFKDDAFGEGIYCSEAAFYLHCENGVVGFKFAQKGCERYTHQRIGNDFKAGRDMDLDYLILDYQQFRTVSIKGMAGDIILMVDGEELETFSEQKQLGEVRGMHFWFKGSPYIDYVSLTDKDGKLHFIDEFN